MRKIFFVLLGFLFITWNIAGAAQQDLEVQGRRLVSKKPPFTITSPSELNLIHTFSQENPGESSLTRVYFFVKTRGKQVEEMLILQIADKTNPQAGPMTVAPLKPYTEKRLYSKKKVKRGELEVDSLVQLMAWNPDAPSLQPILKKGLIIPSIWALQGQFLFLYQGEHAVYFRYSKSINSFGIKVSERGDDWDKGLIKGNEKRVYEIFEKMFLGMLETIQIKVP
jgi:hypothetical protein